MMAMAIRGDIVRSISERNTEEVTAAAMMTAAVTESEGDTRTKRDTRIANTKRRRSEDTKRPAKSTRSTAIDPKKGMTNTMMHHIHLRLYQITSGRF
jgi:hypothetical protein